MAIGHDRNHDGRVDARDGVVHGTSSTDRVGGERVVHTTDPSLTKEVRRDAYERGRSDERSRHKRNPLLTFLIALAAVLGLAVTALFIYNGGSFTEAGRDLDQVTGRAAQEAREVGAEVADEAGEAMQDTGRRVEQTGESAQQQPATDPAQRP
jgi:type VI protein secretion system component VasK